MNIQKLMKQAQQMQSKMDEMQAKMAEIEVTGESGGGMVKATFNGKGEARAISIDSSLMDPEETEVLEDLLVAAINNAKSESEKIMQEEMSKVTGGLNLPPGMKFPM